jgi:hypothetical protein
MYKYKGYLKDEEKCVIGIPEVFLIDDFSEQKTLTTPPPPSPQ